MLSFHCAFPVHLAFGVLTCSARRLTRPTPAFLLDIVLPTRLCQPRVACLLACDIRCCLSVCMTFSSWILTSCCQWQTRLCSRHFDLVTNCFHEQLETSCCLSNSTVSGTHLRMLVLLDLHDLRDACVRFSDATFHRIQGSSVTLNCWVKSELKSCDS